jgi:toxin FitB
VLLLDTNILSALMLARPDPAVIAWLDAAPEDSLWVSTVTVFEIRFGIAALPSGRKRERLAAAFTDLVAIDLAGRVLDFDADAAEFAAQLAGARRAAGRSVEFRDTMIAGIALARRASIVTRNEKDFDHPGLTVINPWAL